MFSFISHLVCFLKEKRKYWQFILHRMYKALYYFAYKFNINTKQAKQINNIVSTLQNKNKENTCTTVNHTLQTMWLIN